MTTGFHTGFSQKKVNEFFIFVIFDVLFIDVRHILDNCRSQMRPLGEWTNLFNFFILQLMAFISMEINFFPKKKKLQILRFFLFCLIVVYFH